MTECRRPLADAVSDRDVEFRLALTRALQIDLDNMVRLRRTWARDDRRAAGALRTMADSTCHAEDNRAYLRLAARRLDELATAEEELPRIFALTDHSGTMVEITGVTIRGGQIQAALVLRRAAELGAVRVSSFLTTLNTPLVDFPDPPQSVQSDQIAAGSRPQAGIIPGVRPEDTTHGPITATKETPTLAERIDAEDDLPILTRGDIEGLEQSRTFLQTQLAEAEQVIRALVSAVDPLSVKGRKIRTLDSRLSVALEKAEELLAEYEPTDLDTRTPRY